MGTESKVQQIAAVANQIEQARKAYDGAPESDSAALDTLLAMWSIECGLGRISAATNNPPNPEPPRVSSITVDERKQQAKLCRAKLDRVAIAVERIQEDQQRLLAEYQRQQGVSKARHRWAQTLGFVFSGTSVCAGSGVLLLAFRSRLRSWPNRP